MPSSHLDNKALGRNSLLEKILKFPTKDCGNVGKALKLSAIRVYYGLKS